MDVHDHAFDPIFGSGGAGVGPWAHAFARLWDAARQVRDTEYADDVAVTMIRDAAGDKRAVLHTFVEGFTRRNWHGDPLLVRVSDLVRAAETGQVPAPLDPAAAEVVRDERRLLNASSEGGFALLAQRQPGLVELASNISDPEWRAEQDANPPPPPPFSPPEDSDEVVPGVWASRSNPRLANRLVGWYLKRALNKAEEMKIQHATDPRWVQYEKSHDEYRSHAGTMAALQYEWRRLVGPEADSDDPLIKSVVAARVAQDHLAELTGIQRPALPPRA